MSPAAVNLIFKLGITCNHNENSKSLYINLDLFIITSQEILK